MLLKILLTGFEPFGGEPINPSWETVRRVTAPAGTELIRLCLPVSYLEARHKLREAATSVLPNVILSVGQAGGRDGISLERIAVNLMDARIPDNTGFQPVDEPISEDGPAAYFSTLPLRPMLAALNEVCLPAAISNTAGLYVCNAVFYEAARLQSLGVSEQAGFVHVPFLPEQAAGKGSPSMPLEEMIRGLEIILKELTKKR